MSDKIIQIQTGATTQKSWFKGLVQALKEWNVRRAAKAELQALPAHLLNDIGISRDLINQYVDGTIVRRVSDVANVVELDRKAAEPNRHAKAA